jgi:hypothetical protein
MKDEFSSEPNIQRIKLPFTMKSKLQNKILAVLIFPLGLFLLFIFVWGFVDVISKKEFLGLILLFLIVGPLASFCFIWPIIAVTKITCNEDGIAFSACSITYSKILWKNITKVKVETLNFSAAASGLRNIGSIGTTPVNAKITILDIFHRGAFLGFASGVSISNYDQKDLNLFHQLICRNVSVENRDFN